jgi:hypothetical protein
MAVFHFFHNFKICEVLQRVFLDEIAIFRVIVAQDGHNIRPSSFASVVDSDDERPTLGYHLKTGHTLSLQNRPTGLA